MVRRYFHNGCLRVYIKGENQTDIKGCSLTGTADPIYAEPPRDPSLRGEETPRPTARGSVINKEDDHRKETQDEEEREAKKINK